MEEVRNDIVERLIKGAVDAHIHSGPGLITRSLSHIDACKEAMDAGLKAIVLKDQHTSTANLPYLLKETVIKDNPLQVFGAIALNSTAGGLNPSVVELAVEYGAKIIWMPTLSANYHRDYHKRISSTARKSLPKANSSLKYDWGLSIVDGNGRLLPEVKEIISIIASKNLVLGNGHISKMETDLLIEEAKAQGVKKIVVNHPELQLGLTLDEMKEYAREGVYLEHILAIIYSNKSSHEYIYEMIKATGTDHVFISSDLGQVGRPRPIAAIKEFVLKMLELGLTETEIKTIICDNPSKLLDI